MTPERTDIKIIVSQAVKETLLQLGFDVNDPTELQADMAHLRYWRMTLNEITTKSMIGGVIFIIGSMLSLLWVGVQVILGRP